MPLYVSHAILLLVVSVSPILAFLQMMGAIEKELKLANLQNIPITSTKIIQLYETKNSRSAAPSFIIYLVRASAINHYCAICTTAACT